jgi:molybdenum cofactor biosynthesis enzyme MoaA
MSTEIKLDTSGFGHSEHEFCNSTKLLYQAADFLYNEGSVNVQGFQNLIRTFGDQPPLGCLESNLKIITTITQHPTASANKIQEISECNLSDIKGVQLWMQKSRFIGQTMRSHFYPGYLLIRYAQSFLSDLSDNPDYLKHAESQDIIAPKRLEIHVTNANCNYRCEMCLWHANNQAKYETHGEVLSANKWEEVLCQAKNRGTEIVVFSGGGEPLLRSDISQVINYAKKIGLSTMIYTNGSMLHKMSTDSDLYHALLNTDWLRVSLHATTEERYSKLVNIPENLKAFTKVVEGIQHLKNGRDKANLPLKLGIGFVIQSLNFDQVENVVELANDLKLDFLNLRVDCINITEDLKPDETTALYNQLSVIRKRIDNNSYGNLSVDFDDRLVASMNGWRVPEIDNPSTCRVHLYRSAIDPYGRVAVCDLVSEPYFSKDELTLGYINPNTDYQTILQKTAKRTFDSGLCDNCMPGQQTINALWSKVLEDSKIGFNPSEQGILFKY